MPTMYIKNKRDCSSIKVCSTLELSCNLKFCASKSLTFHILTVADEYSAIATYSSATAPARLVTLRSTLRFELTATMDINHFFYFEILRIFQNKKNASCPEPLYLI